MQTRRNPAWYDQVAVEYERLFKEPLYADLGHVEPLYDRACGEVQCGEDLTMVHLPHNEACIRTALAVGALAHGEQAVTVR